MHSLPAQKELARVALEQADDCYALMIESGESPNIDRAGYASHIQLAEFRAILNRPLMEEDELAALLRQARRHALADRSNGDSPKPVRIPKPVLAPASSDTPSHSWAELMAGFIVTNANDV